MATPVTRICRPAPTLGAMRRWGPAALVAVLAVAVLLVDVTAGAVVVGIVLCVLLALYALMVSPVMPPGSVSAEEAQRRSASDGRPVVYWRPGCMYCIRLRLSLLTRRAAWRLHWVDIWADPEGAAVVRGITGGDETVPTVVAGGESRVNPAPAWVHDRTRGAVTLP